MSTPFSGGLATDVPVTVLMTGAGAPGASGIVRSLRRSSEPDVRIVGVDMDPQAYGFALVDDHAVVPPGDEHPIVEHGDLVGVGPDLRRGVDPGL
jgi:carbamoyl-phosphate synthase large subunit